MSFRGQYGAYPKPGGSGHPGFPASEEVEQAIAYRSALARRPDWGHETSAAVVEVCGNNGYNWFDLPC